MENSDTEKKWESALRRTEIVRSRVRPLETFQATRMPYVFLSELSSAASGTLVRRGHVVVEKPSLILPPNCQQFEGFEWDASMRAEAGTFMDFLLIRGVHFPSMRFNHASESLSVYDGRLQAAIDHFQGQFQRAEDLDTGLIAGPEDVWQFSVLIFTGAQILRGADGDIHRLLREYKEKKGGF
ncbi:MAG: hypothetical protein FGM27_00875 [Candidatus Omnitrophica bacterium]|nr:hypothetical protein [Candidatus Omnitrophota bacterium]